jgi:hypothetical protein
MGEQTETTENVTSDVTEQPTSESNSLLSGDTTAATETKEPEQTIDGPGDNAYEFVLDKFRTDDRTDEQAATEQAKAYAELEKQFGAFTGAPEEFKLEISDELKESGVVFEEDDPLIEKAMDMAKNMNMSQDGFNQLLNMYSEMQLAEQKAVEDMRTHELEQLGRTGPQRLANIDAFIASKFDGETVQRIQAMATTAESINAIEAMIKAMKGAPMADTEATAAPSVTAQEVQEMQFAKDEFGNRRINTDQAFRKEYERKRDLLYGSAEHRIQVG